MNSDDQDGVGQILQPKSGSLLKFGSSQASTWVRVGGNICSCLSSVFVSCNNAPAFANYSMHCEYLLRCIPKAFRASIGRPQQLAGTVDIFDPLYLSALSVAKHLLNHVEPQVRSHLQQLFPHQQMYLGSTQCSTGRFERHGAAG